MREWPFFWQNLDLRAACFLENGRFLQNMGMRAMIFPWEIGKKGHHIDFFGPEYTVVLTDLTLSLTKYGREGDFHVIFEKKSSEITTFLKEWRFFW